MKADLGHFVPMREISMISLLMCAFILAGCGQAGLGMLDPEPLVEARVLPADLSAALTPDRVGYTNFIGFGYGRTSGTRDTNAKGQYVHVTYNRELTPRFSLEFEAGEIESDEGVSSTLRTVPILAVVQFGQELETGQGRWYLVAGGGMFLNHFELSAADLQSLRSNLVPSDPNITDLDVDSATGFLFGGGIELYRVLRETWNLTLDARHFWQEADVVYIGSTRTDTFHLDSWIFRFTLTYPF